MKTKRVFGSGFVCDSEGFEKQTVDLLKFFLRVRCRGVCVDDDRLRPIGNLNVFGCVLQADSSNVWAWENLRNKPW